jgi:hypothetical protein
MKEPREKTIKNQVKTRDTTRSNQKRIKRESVRKLRKTKWEPRGMLRRNRIELKENQEEIWKENDEETKQHYEMKPSEVKK